jgi:hypothetical protein
MHSLLNYGENCRSEASAREQSRVLALLNRPLVLYLKKLEFPLYQVWLNFACLLWRRRFLNIFSVFLLFCYYLPFEKGYLLCLNKLEFPSPKNDMCQVLLKLAQWFWRRSRKCKSLQTDGQTDGQTDAEQRAIRKAHLSFQLRWAKTPKVWPFWLHFKVLWHYFSG